MIVPSNGICEKNKNNSKKQTKQKQNKTKQKQQKQNAELSRVLNSDMDDQLTETSL